MRLMGLEALYPRPPLSQGGAAHDTAPSWRGELEVSRPTQVWATDITDIRLHAGVVSRVALMDWCRR